MYKGDKNIFKEVQDGIFKEVQDGITELLKEVSAEEHQSFANIEKAEVLQSARAFHDSTIVRENPQNCIRIITQFLYLESNTRYGLETAEAT